MKNKPIEADFRYMLLFLRYSVFCMFYCQIMGQNFKLRVLFWLLAYMLVGNLKIGEQR